MIRNLFKILLAFFFLVASFAFVAQENQVTAQPTCPVTTNPPIDRWTAQTDPDSISITIGSGLIVGDQYYLFLPRTNDSNNPQFIGEGTATSAGVVNSFTWDGDDREFLVEEGSHILLLKDGRNYSTSSTICSYNYNVVSGISCNIRDGKSTSYGPGENIQINGEFWTVELVDGPATPYANHTIKIRLFKKFTNVEIEDDNVDTSSDGVFFNDVGEISIPSVLPEDIGWWRITASEPDDVKVCESAIYVSENSDEIPPGEPPTGGGGLDGTNPCTTGSSGVCRTALGDIPTNPQDFVTRILQIATGLAGGIALIIMVIGSVKVLISSGDPQKVAGGRDMIVAALAGVLFLIFSILILRFIGINVLGLI